MNATMWRPIDTAPKDGTNMLLYVPALKFPIQLGHYSVTEHYSHGKLEYRHEGWSVRSLFGDKPEPTHWMPLPEVPK